MSREEFSQQILLKMIGNIFTENDIDKLVEMSYRLADAHAAYGWRDLRSTPSGLCTKTKGQK